LYLDTDNAKICDPEHREPAFAQFLTLTEIEKYGRHVWRFFLKPGQGTWLPR
jgi:hypothetical protein